MTRHHCPRMRCTHRNTPNEKTERAAKGTRKRCSVVKFQRKKRQKEKKKKKCGKQKNVGENREFPMRLITSWFSATTNNTSQCPPKIRLWPKKEKKNPLGIWRVGRLPLYNMVQSQKQLPLTFYR